MGDYGKHPTQYENLSKDQLYSMYRESIYSRLSEQEKLDLLQETVNRDAAELGELGSPKVQFASMPANESGNAGNGIININRDLAVDGIQSVQHNGKTIQHSVKDYNIQALNTALHENAHCFQDQINDGTISSENKQLKAEYQANDFKVSAVLENGSYKLGSQYLTGETPGGYYIYYFQAAERDAYLWAEKKTAEILQNIAEKYGTEPSFSAYVKNTEVTGYHAMEQEAIQFFNNPNFVKDLNQVLMNQYFGMNKPVDPATEKAVKAEMIESYKALYPVVSQENHLLTKEENGMNFDPNPVSLEEYNQTLKEFQEEQNTQSPINDSIEMEDDKNSTVSEREQAEESEGVDAGESCDDGLDI